MFNSNQNKTSLDENLLVDFKRSSSGSLKEDNNLMLENLDGSETFYETNKLNAVDSTNGKRPPIFRLGGKIKSTRSLFANKNDTDTNELNKTNKNDPKKVNDEIIAKKSLKAPKDLGDRMEEMQVEISKMILRLEKKLLSNIYESEHNISKDISKLSDRLNHMESMFSKKSLDNPIPNNNVVNILGKQNDANKGKANHQIETKKRIKKREALVTSIVDLSHVVKNIPKSNEIKNLLNKQLQSNIFFQTCPKEILDDIKNAFEFKSYKSGSMIIEQNSEADRFFVVDEGVLDVIQDSEHVDVLKAPNSFGEIALLFGSSYHVSVYARSDCKLWFLNQQDYRTVTSQYKLKRMQYKFDFLRKVRFCLFQC